MLKWGPTLKVVPSLEKSLKHTALSYDLTSRRIRGTVKMMQVPEVAPHGPKPQVGHKQIGASQKEGKLQKIWLSSWSPFNTNQKRVASQEHTLAVRGTQGK